jgi:hypothetical protein
MGPNLHTKQVSPLVTMMREITYDPMALGLRQAIPATVYRSLMQLGITSLADLTHARGTHMISTTDLARKYGSKVSNKHKQALNVLTCLINEHAPDGVTMPKCGVLPFNRARRKINRGHVAMELAAEVALAPVSKASTVLRRFLQMESKADDQHIDSSNHAPDNRNYVTPNKRDRPTDVSSNSDSDEDADECNMRQSAQASRG